MSLTVEDVAKITADVILGRKLRIAGQEAEAMAKDIADEIKIIREAGYTPAVIREVPDPDDDEGSQSKSMQGHYGPQFKHNGPGPHESGSDQSVHGKGGVGDVVINGGKQSHTITGFESHPGLDGKTARVFRSGSYGCTLFDDEGFYETSDGGWIRSHLWWSYEHR